MDRQPRPPSVYRLSTAHVIRLVAPFEVLIGLAWIGVAVTGLDIGWTRVVLLATVVVGLAGAAVFVRPPAVLTLDDDGYRIGLARAQGRATATWREVESVATADAAGTPMLVFTLADGSRSALPLSLLGPRNGEAQRDVHERLNTAYGYRRF